MLHAYLDGRFSAVISRPLPRELAAVVVRPQLSKRVLTWSTNAAALVALFGARADGGDRGDLTKQGATLRQR